METSAVCNVADLGGSEHSTAFRVGVRLRLNYIKLHEALMISLGILDSKEGYK